MMAMIFIDDPCYPYKTCFLPATVIKLTSPLFILLSYSTSTATFHSRWIQAFHLFSCFKKKITHRLKQRDEIITFLTVPLLEVYVAQNFMGRKCRIQILHSKKTNPSPAKDADLWGLGMISALMMN